MEDFGYLIGYLIGWCAMAWAIYGIGNFLTRRVIGRPDTKDLERKIRYIERRLDLFEARENYARGPITRREDV